MNHPQAQPCNHCAVLIPHTKQVCPHCGQPARFPNVIIADSTEEKDALEGLYRDCRDDAKRNGCVKELDEFGDACSRSKAVFTCPFDKLIPIVTNQTQVFADFYALASLRCRTDASDKDWDSLRIKAETDLIGGDPTDLKILYASLSIDGFGLAAYGECTVTLRESMIGHRATVFPENSALYFEENNGKPKLGMRASWQNRHKLCTIKYAKDLTAGVANSEFPRILLKSSPDGLTDRLVEVHVVGPVTVRTFDEIRIPKPVNLGNRVVDYFGTTVSVKRPGKMYFEACRNLCVTNDVKFEGT